VVELSLEGKTLDAAVRDVGTGDLLFRRQYDPVPGESLRARLHRFADDAVGALTGQKGLSRTRVLCEWNPGDGKRIVVMDVDGYGMRELTGDKVLELGPRWTPDGRKAIYTSYRSGYPDVYIQTLATGAREKVAHYEGLNAQGDLSPDGRTLVLMLSFQGNPEIYARDMASSRLRRLTSHPATDTTPVWSPDGRRIAFVSDRSGSPQVYVMNEDGSRTERVTLRGSYNTAPDWSPDGTRIAYCALRSDGFQIQVLELESGKVTTVTEFSGCEDPAWSPDGRSILFSRKAGGRAELYVVDVNEQRTLRVSRGSGSFSAPDWSPIP
jgi:TolB protein